MAHELEFSKQSGKANFFEVGTTRTAWHREGHLLTEAPSLQGALARCEMDYEVVKRPTFRQVGQGEGVQYLQNEAAYVTVRTDTGAELGAVGSRYVPLQNLDSFAPIEPLLDKGVLVLETGGILRGGADAWLLGRFDLAQFGPVVREVFADEVIPYALFTNNHSGRRNATVAETPIRVVCANTLGMAEHGMDASGRSVAVRHTESGKLNMIEAAEKMFGAVIERYETVAAQYRLLKQAYLTPAEFSKLVLDVVAPDPRKDPKFNPEAKLAGLVVERADLKRSEITRLWTTGRGHTGDQSAWEAYNAVAEAVDHNEKLFPTKGGSWRSAGLMDGYLRGLKDSALKVLVGFANKADTLSA